MKGLKQLTITVIFVVFALYSASAQSFRGGIMAGLSTSQVDGDTRGGYHRAGLIAGGYVGFDISKKIAWQMEMKFVQKGSYQGINPNDSIMSTSYDLRLNYIEMPLLFKYQYKDRLAFEAGLGFGYLISHKENSEYGPIYPNNIHPFHKFEIDYQIGGSYQLLENLYFNIRYSYSVLPIRQDINGARRILFQIGQFNNVIIFSFYYQFNKPDE